MSDASTTWRALTSERLRFIFVDSTTFGGFLDVVSTVAIGFAGVAGVICRSRSG